jgi:transaldolase
MKFFVDTADVKEIKELNDLGLLDGVTTNPSLILKSGRNFAEVTKEICDRRGPGLGRGRRTDYSG